MDTEKAKTITVTHLNIRPSISVLVAQLVLLDVLVAAVLIGGYLVILHFQNAISIVLKSYFGLFLLWFVFILQVGLTIYATLYWINDYYELTSDTLIHKKGLINRKIERYPLDNLTYLNVEQGFLGSLLNYGTLTFLSPRREKLLELYLIHNPNKYLEVLESLKPNFGEVEDVLRGGVEEDTGEEKETELD